MTGKTRSLLNLSEGAWPLARGPVEATSLTARARAQADGAIGETRAIGAVARLAKAHAGSASNGRATRRVGCGSWRRTISMSSSGVFASLRREAQQWGRLAFGKAKSKPAVMRGSGR
jgi:hypothetical protein